MTTTTTYTPTDDEWAALRAYAEQHGRTWKSSLLSDWLRSGSGTLYRGDWAPLQRLRNRLGPTWLKKLNLKTSMQHLCVNHASRLE